MMMRSFLVTAARCGPQSGSTSGSIKCAHRAVSTVSRAAASTTTPSSTTATLGGSGAPSPSLGPAHLQQAKTGVTYGICAAITAAGYVAFDASCMQAENSKQGVAAGKEFHKKVSERYYGTTAEQASGAEAVVEKSAEVGVEKSAEAGAEKSSAGTA